MDALSRDGVAGQTDPQPPVWLLRCSRCYLSHSWTMEPVTSRILPMVAIPDRDSPDQANTRYGQFFADLHIPCARSLHNTRIKEGTPGTRRTGINLGFREHHLRVEVRSTHAAPPDGAMLLVEQVLPGDVSLDGEVVGGAAGDARRRQTSAHCQGRCGPCRPGPSRCAGRTPARGRPGEPTRPGSSSVAA